MGPPTLEGLDEPSYILSALIGESASLLIRDRMK